MKYFLSHILHSLRIQWTGSASALGTGLLVYVVTTLLVKDDIHWLTYSTLLDPWCWLLSCVCTLISFLHPDFRYTLAVLPFSAMLIYTILLFPQAITHLPSSPALPHTDTNLTLLTWNILGGRANQACLLQVLHTHQPDVVMFQEAGGFTMEAAPSYRYQTRSGNLVILSKFQIVESVEFGRHPRNGHDVGLQAQLRLEGVEHPLTLINTYLPKPFVVPSQLIYEADDRIAGAERYVRAVEQAAGAVILAGDHNMGMRAPEYRLLNQFLLDTWAERGRGWGFTANHHPQIPPLVRVDYIWHSVDLQANWIEVVRADCGDHYAVMAGFRVD